MDIWTAKAESGFTLARDSRSVERTKKFPWNVWMDRPEGGREQTHKTTAETFTLISDGLVTTLSPYALNSAAYI